MTTPLEATRAGRDGARHDFAEFGGEYVRDRARRFLNDHAALTAYAREYRVAYASTTLDLITGGTR